MKSLCIEPRYIVDNAGKKKEVVLSIKTFEKMLELLDDAALAQEALRAFKEDELIDFKEANKRILNNV